MRARSPCSGPRDQQLANGIVAAAIVAYCHGTQVIDPRLRCGCHRSYVDRTVDLATSNSTTMAPTGLRRSFDLAHQHTGYLTTPEVIQVMHHSRRTRTFESTKSVEIQMT
jgi:hypothetical protein